MKYSLVKLVALVEFLCVLQLFAVQISQPAIDEELRLFGSLSHVVRKVARPCELRQVLQFLIEDTAHARSFRRG